MNQNFWSFYRYVSAEVKSSNLVDTKVEVECQNAKGIPEESLMTIIIVDLIHSYETSDIPDNIYR